MWHVFLKLCEINFARQYRIANYILDFYAPSVKLAIEIDSFRRFAMFSLISILPGVSLLLCAIPIFKYDLVGEKKDRITRELAEMRKAEGVTIE